MPCTTPNPPPPTPITSLPPSPYCRRHPRKQACFLEYLRLLLCISFVPHFLVRENHNSKIPRIKPSISAKRDQRIINKRMRKGIKQPSKNVKCYNEGTPTCEVFLALRGTGIGASPHVGRLSACLPTPEPRPLPLMNTAVHPPWN